MKHVWPFIWLSGAFLLLFLVAEILFRYFSVRAEYTRKFVHVGTGLLTLLFPLYLQSHWQVMGLCASFAVILFLSERGALLPSIHATERKSKGSLMYPLAVWLSFFASEKMEAKFEVHPFLYFYIPVMVMALADPAAAMIGRKWPIKSFVIGAGRKSVAGSATFFLVACLVCGTTGFFTGASICTQICIAVALTATLAEAVTPGGYDNLTIPVVCLLVLVGAQY